ncbi:BTB/POZ and MATH domain-containing protein 3-like [Triticum urartu]|uniref:BTB/POZ and MATH domain-containing protein 3-like n=1 Tax=Triticum urartu TaxID=4572 RepID=UPI0020437F6B|nr:BTB/POZ and MATH domain-containing protein 3-like [Triticum urartu]
MSSFAGVSVLADGELCPATESSVGITADYGYHLLVVHDYLRTKEEAHTGEGIRSRPFMLGGHRWLIHYYPNGETTNCADFISLSLSCLQDDAKKKHVEAKFIFSFIDQIEMQNPVHFAEIKTCSFTGCAWGCDKFIRKDALEQSVNLKDDCFTIRCDIMVYNTEDDAAGSKARLPDICHDYNILLETEAGADVAFEVGGEKFAAHRCVLAARSKVFMAQLFGPMKEGTRTSSVIQIQDMEPKLFKALLSFIYTDTLPLEQGQEEEAAEGKMSGVVEHEQEMEAAEDEMWLQWLQDLLVAADRYDVQRLKCICENHLSEHICVSMVMSSVALAEQHHCQRLKEACFKFIQVQAPLVSTNINGI